MASQICLQPLNRQLFGKSLHCFGLVEWTRQDLSFSKMHEPFLLFFRVSPLRCSLNFVYFSVNSFDDRPSSFAIAVISISLTMTSPGQLQQFVHLSH